MVFMLVQRISAQKHFSNLLLSELMADADTNILGGRLHNTIFNQKIFFMCFGRSFIQQHHLGGLKTQTFENGFQSVRFSK